MKHIEKDEGGEIINLSPIRWLQDPLAEYKRGSDWKKFEDIREKIADLEIIKSNDAEKFFGIALPFELGIYHITNNGGWKSPFENKLLCKMVDGIKDNVKNHIVIDNLSGISLLVSMFTGGSGGRVYEDSEWMLTKEKSYFTDGKNDFTGETYLEQRTKAAWGNVKPKAENTNIKFATTEERDNFYESWSTKLLRWLFNAMKVDVHVHPQFLPFMPTYTRPWTDEDLYEYFGLDEEEIKTIEEEMKMKH